jgi:hypothetical protein
MYEKIGSLIVISLLTMNTFAKGSSHPKVSEDVGLSRVGACMIQLDDANTSRFLNVNYIRSIEVADKDAKNPKERIMRVVMMGNAYPSAYLILYTSKEQAVFAMKDLAVRINQCGK